jgi:hypothetical protein
MANVAAAPQRKDGAAQHHKELALRLTHRRHLVRILVTMVMAMRLGMYCQLTFNQLMVIFVNPFR